MLTDLRLYSRQCARSGALAAAAALGDNSLFIVGYLMRLLRVMLLVSVWRALYAGRGAIAGMPLQSVLTYTVISEALAEAMAGRTELFTDFWNGTIVMRYLRPMGVFSQVTAEAAGMWCLNAGLFSLPLLLLAPLAGIVVHPANVSGGALFVASLILAVAVALAIDFLAGALAIRAGLHIYAVMRVRSAVTALLSGALIPLALMPWGIGTVLGWLPFASMASAPLKIFTGASDARRLIALQAVWAAVLWPLCVLQWNLAREKMVSYGG